MLNLYVTLNYVETVGRNSLTPVSTVRISLRRFSRNSQPRSTGLWTFPVSNFIRIESRMQKRGSNVNLCPYIKVQISLQRFARGPLKKRHQVFTGFHPPRSRNMENMGRDSCGSLSDVWLTQSIVTKCRLFIKNSYTELHKNPINALVADTTSQTARPTSVSSHMRSQFFYKRRKMSPHIRRHPWVTNLPTKKKKVSISLASAILCRSPASAILCPTPVHETCS